MTTQGAAKRSFARPLSPKLHLRLLGGFHALLPSGREIALANRKDQGLLAYLALNPDQSHSREKLAHLLWGQFDDASARHSLRQALLSLRRAGVGPAITTANRNTVIVRNEAIEVDVYQFLYLAGQKNDASLERAVELYRGDLLEGCLVGDEAFQTSLSDLRQRVRDAAQSVFCQLQIAYQRRGHLHRAIDCTRRILQIDPYNEAALRNSMELLVKAGCDLEALRTYQEFAALLQQELGVEPEQQTKEMCLKIASGRLVRGELPSRASHAQSRNLIEAFRSLDGFVVWDQSDRFVLCNDRFREIFKPASELLKPGMSWESIMRRCIERGRFPEALKDGEAYLRARLKRRRSGRAEAPDVLLDDHHCFRMTHRHTEIGGLVVIFSDVTNRRNRELALYRSHLKLQALLSAAPFGVEEVDLDGRIVFCNAVLCRLLGRQPGMLIGRFQSEFMSFPWAGPESEGDREKASANRRRMPRLRGRSMTEYVTGTGQRLAAAVDWSAIVDEEGKITGRIGVVTPLAAGDAFIRARRARPL